MPSPDKSLPPRPISPGDIVAAYSISLGEWSAAQIIDIDPTIQRASVLDLDWSGPEPNAVGDLGDVRPLRLTHHSWNNTLSYCNYEWVLPRSFKVIGTLPLLHDKSANSFSGGWPVGDQLARQRRWDGGESDEPERPWRAEYANAALGQLARPRPEITHLRVSDIDTLDCGWLVTHFPALTTLYLTGDLGLLVAAERLNELTSLRRIEIRDLFGMTKDDRLLPERVPELEALRLNGIPVEYATATRSAWRSEIPNGVYVDIVKARKPEWVAENRDNPLRDWDGRISPTRFRKCVAQYKLTRRAIMAALADEPTQDRLFEIGEEYGEAFNALDQGDEFIETVEREELFAALDHVVAEAEASLGQEFAWARESLASGVESVRDW